MYISVGVLALGAWLGEAWVAQVAGSPGDLVGVQVLGNAGVAMGDSFVDCEDAGSLGEEAGEAHEAAVVD